MAVGIFWRLWKIAFHVLKSLVERSWALECPGGPKLTGTGEMSGFKWYSNSCCVRQRRSILTGKDNSGQTPLSWAAKRKHETVAKLQLATEKADIESKDNSG
jgi:ankyrin repeat protein